MRILLSMALVALLAAPVVADPPIQDVYLSDDMPGGTMLTGYFSESWVGTGSHGQLGNTLHAESFDGTLGTEWRSDLIAHIIGGGNVVEHLASTGASVGGKNILAAWRFTGIRIPPDPIEAQKQLAAGLERRQ